MVLHLSNADSDFDVSFNDITKNDDFYTIFILLGHSYWFGLVSSPRNVRVSTVVAQG